MEFYFTRYRTHIRAVYFLELQPMYNIIYINRTQCIRTVAQPHHASFEFEPHAAAHAIRKRICVHFGSDSAVRTLRRHDRNKSGDKPYKYFTSE